MSDTNQQSIDWSEHFTEEALNDRHTAMNQDEQYGPNGAKAHQQALRHDRMLEIVDAHEGDDLIDTDEMFANAEAWITEQLEEDPELFDPMIDTDAFEEKVVPILDQMTGRERGRFLKALTAKFNGQKNVSDELTDEVLEELQEEADPRENVEYDGNPVECVICGETFQPERWDDSNRESQKGHFVARNGEISPVCSRDKQRFAKAYHKLTEGYWPRWETREDAEERQARQAKAIARKQEREAETTQKVAEALGFDESDDAMTRVRKTRRAMRRDR